MADDGHLYSIYTPTMIDAMRHLVSRAHILKPNYTEACFLLDIPYSNDSITDEELLRRCQALHKMGPEMIIMTSVPSDTHAIVAVYDGLHDTLHKLSIPLVPVKATGTGDIFTAVLSGCIMRGFTPYESANAAMNFTTKAIQTTVDTVGSMEHGIAFELVLKDLLTLTHK